MADKMYWATKCTRCSGMVGYRDVGYVLSIDGMRTEEALPVGTMRLRCDHCGTVSDFNLRSTTSACGPVPRAMDLLTPSHSVGESIPNHT